MKQLLLIVSFFLCTTSLWSQKEYAKGILKTLCSDFFAGRGYVNDGVDKAASYIVNELKKNDIQSFPGRSYVQNYDFDVNTFPHKVTVILGDDTLRAGIDYLVDPNSGQTKGEFIPQIITINNLENHLKSVGSVINHTTILVFDSRSIISRDSVHLFMAAAFEANKLVPVIWLSNQKLMYSVGRQNRKHAFISVDGKAFNLSETIRLAIEPVFVKKFPNKNVIGFIPGKKKKKYIVLTGHYDHLGKMGQATFPGANDNASGVAMLLSLAKYYSTHQPKYSLVFIFFSGEEAGLEGSKYFVRHPFFELSRVKFLLNIDILGSASEGITAVNGSIHKRHFKLLEKLNRKGNYLPSIEARGPTKNSDHYYFSQTGIPSFFVYSRGNCKNYHDINDTAENTSLDNFNGVMSLFVKFIGKL